MFIKKGNPQPLKIKKVCCECEKSAVTIVDRKPYCAEHLPAKYSSKDSQ